MVSDVNDSKKTVVVAESRRTDSVTETISKYKKKRMESAALVAPPVSGNQSQLLAKSDKPPSSSNQAEFIQVAQLVE